jgi:hypothetical protein
MLLPGLPTQYPACVRLLCSAPAYAARAICQRRPASAVSALERRAAEDWGRGTVAVKANVKEKAPVSRPGLATGGEKVAQNTKE